ncbi:hypothetical protein CYLTODRAFT_394412 [Cylindrobasidium torrendii FP15055 ss-10]|uniref:C2H2-type domain-containing protein n=1 Tax=Cylindrobasidium torrendii FP15055 ss-10 TaxID=1314674 RepID=A0A0D7BHA2_9AGAR|nr:hypothetical protein CYLTODRAFT_394412 [Cylindrobasidium torrendii FP15055 ss-10]
MPRVATQKSDSYSSSSSSTPAKKKHVCPTCDRAFTTSGHLARHSRVHTGERNHKCPFPGCETRCSRQDNLQQHYRIHLSPGSRRNSARSNIARVLNNNAPPVAKKEESPPPNLEPASYYNRSMTPPDSPPALTPATLGPPHASLPPSSSPTDTYYESPNNGTSGYTYVHSTPAPQQPTNQLSPVHSHQMLHHTQPHSHTHLQSHPMSTQSSTLAHPHHQQPYEPPSRHSISHISPPSPESSSGPSTPYQQYAHDTYAHQHVARYDSPKPVLPPLRGVERGYYYNNSNAPPQDWRGKGIVQ